MSDQVAIPASNSGALLDRLSDPSNFSNVTGSLLAVIEAFGGHVAGPGAAIATLAYTILQIIHPAPETVKRPAAVPPPAAPAS